MSPPGLPVAASASSSAPYPHHRLIPFLETVRPALVIGDENPLRQAEAWRATVADLVKVPFWTVDADVVVPTALIESEQYAARTIRPRIHRHLAAHLVPSRDPVARVRWPLTDVSVPREAPDVLNGLPIDRRVGAVNAFVGGTAAARRALRRLRAAAEHPLQVDAALRTSAGCRCPRPRRLPSCARSASEARRIAASSRRRPRRLLLQRRAKGGAVRRAANLVWHSPCPDPAIEPPPVRPPRPARVRRPPRPPLRDAPVSAWDS